MASSRERVAEQRQGTDGRTSTVVAYTMTPDVIQTLEEMQSHREKLLAMLKGKQEETAKLRAQVESQRVQERSWEEQEHAAQERVRQLNEELQAVKEQVERTRTRGEKLLQIRLKKVSEFEAEMRGLSSEFRSLQLLEKGEDGRSEKIAEELAELENDVPVLEEEHVVFTTDDATSIPLETALSQVSDWSALVKKLAEEVSMLEDVLGALKQQLGHKYQKPTGSELQQETGGFTVQQNTCMMQQ